MQHITFSADIDGSSFDVCINPSDFTTAYNVFELKLDGKHYQYVFQNRKTGEYFLGEDAKLTTKDLEHLKLHIEKNRTKIEQREDA